MTDDLLFSLKMARQSLPSDTHHIHAARLYLIERIVARALDWMLSRSIGGTR
jgi:hypothetical protein